MPHCKFDLLLQNGGTFQVGNNSSLDLMQVQVLKVSPGWTNPIELWVAYDMFGAEDISSVLWSSKRLEPHSTSVNLRVDGCCKIKAKGADIKISGNRIGESPAGGSRTVESGASRTVASEDGSCVLL